MIDHSFGSKKVSKVLLESFIAGNILETPLQSNPLCLLSSFTKGDCCSYSCGVGCCGESILILGSNFLALKHRIHHDVNLIFGEVERIDGDQNMLAKKQSKPIELESKFKSRPKGPGPDRPLACPACQSVSQVVYNNV